MIRYFLFLTVLLGTVISSEAQMDFSRYVDETSVPVFDIDRHLDIKFEWKMGGKVQMHMNEGLNYIEEDNLDLALSNLDDVLKIDSVFWPAHYYRGVVFTKKREFKDAHKAFRNVTRLNPKQAQAHIELGRLHQRVKDYKGARTFYEQAIAIDPTVAAGHFGLALMELFRGEPRRAVRLFETCTEVDSSYAEAYVVLSIIKFRDKKKNNESIGLLNRALKANPTYTHTYFWRGYFHVMLGETDKCLADWTNYINFNPGNPFMLTMRGFLYIEMNRFDEAFTDMRKAFLSRQINEEAFKGAQTLLDKQIDLQAATQYLLRTGYGLKDETFAHVKKGYCLLLAGKSKVAVEELDKAMKMEMSPTVLLLLGIAFEHVNNHPAAYQCYDKALQLDNDIFDAHKKRCIYRMELKNWPGVDEDIRHMMRLMPESMMPYRFRGLAKSLQADYHGAIADLTKYIAYDSTDFESLRTRSACKTLLHDNKGANEDMRLMISLQPKNWSLYTDVVHNYLLLHDTVNALEVLRQHVEARPGVYVPLLHLARVLVATKQWNEARQRIDVVIPMFNVEWLGQQHAEALYLLGEVFYAQGDFQSATGKCSEALSLDDSNLAAKYLRAKCYEQTGERKKAMTAFKDLGRKGYRDSQARYDQLAKQ